MGKRAERGSRAGTRSIAVPGGGRASEAFPMRYATFLPRQRPMFGRRTEAAEVVAVQPTREERRLVQSIVRLMGPAKPR